MAAWTDFAENKIIDAVFRAQALGAPATWYVALLTTNQNDAGTAEVEVTGGAYARVAIAASLVNFAGTQGAGTTVASTGATGTTSNNIVLTYPAPTANWGSVVGMEFYDAATGGNSWLYTPLATPKTVNNGDPAPSFQIGAITFQVDN